MGILRFMGIAFVAIILGGYVSADVPSTFGKSAETWDAEVSPDGKKVALGCSPTGVRAICIYALGSSAKPKLFQPPSDQNLRSYVWLGPNHLGIEIDFFERIQTGEGMRDYTVYRMLSHNTETGKTVMLMRQLKNFIGRASIASLLVDEDDKILMSFRYGEYATFRVDLDNGKGKMVESLRDGAFIQHDAKGTMIVKETYDWDQRDYELIRVAGGRKKLFEDKDARPLPYSIWGLSPDGESLVARGETQATEGLKYISLEDGRMSPLTVNGQSAGDAGRILDRYTQRLVGLTYHDDLTKQVFLDEELAGVHEMLSGALTGERVRLLSWTADRSVFTFTSETAGTPATFYLFDKSDASVSPLGSVAPQLAEVPLGKVETINYAAADGTNIDAILTLPAGKSRDDGPFPLVLFPHGGPETYDTTAYDWWAQAMAASGYAVLQPNYRGSSGYGTKFRDAGYGELGGKMVTDVVDGGQFLISEGIATESGWCVVGASYGGYSALMSGLLEPKKTGCIASVNGVTDYFSMAAHDGSAQENDDYLGRYLGATVYASGAEKKRISPVDRTAEYSQPILILHGSDDTTVPIEQAKKFKRAWGKKDKLRYVELDGQDHYLSSTEARKTVLLETLAFLNANHPAR